jgi:N-acetylglucosaminyldiphosphoundecaprenol N-acetyl-beta-D-mannosaminyltransferase
MKPLAHAFAKRAFDLLLAAALLVVVAPIACVALLPVRRRLLPSFGSVARAGRDGRTFLLRHEVLGERRSPLLRRLARSPLPQWPVLLGILAGDLSFVGPRPLELAEAAALAPPDRDRFAVRPGLVCHWWVWQRTNIDFGSEADADRLYLHQRSLAADLAILLRALLAMPYGKSGGTRPVAARIGGVRLLNLGMDELVDAIVLAVEKRHMTRVAFVNPDCVNIAARDPQYRALLAGTDWVCPDGIGMKIAGRILDQPIRQNLNGTDLFPRLCAALEAGGRSVYLLGAHPGVAQAVAQWARHHYPGLAIAGFRSGYWPPGEEEAVAAEIRQSKADVLLVALGVPRQELWLKRNLRRSGATVGIGVGGLFDFYGGRIPRAPLWLREVGGEWIFRLLQEPRRMWRRYLVGNFAFLWRVARERMAAARAAGG